MNAQEDRLSAPLDNITVITVESYMAAPSASAILADLGARVIKIEPPSGDPNRGMSRKPKIDAAINTIDCGFDVDNRGKQSIALRLDTEKGRALTHKLVKGSQIFMCNLLIERQKKFKVDPKSGFIRWNFVHFSLGIAQQDSRSCSIQFWKLYDPIFYPRDLPRFPTS